MSMIDEGMLAVKNELAEIDEINAALAALRDAARLINKLVFDQVRTLEAERDFLSTEARRIASHYPESSDGRNTFIMFAEMIEARKGGGE